MKFCEAGKAEGYVSSVTVLDVMYILRKHIKPADIRLAVQTFLTIVDVADIRKSDIIGAFAGKMKDYEDAVQAMCANRNKADYIVTRNVRDFAGSPVKAILPYDILTILRCK
jgi:predicted nucleic acid-binding protein